MTQNKFNTNNKTALFAVSNVDNETPVYLWADPNTHALITSGGGGGGGGNGAILDYVNNAIGANVVQSTTSPGVYGQVVVNPDGSTISGGGGGGGGTQYAEGITTSPATGTVSLGRYNTSSPTLTNGQLNAPQLDVNSNLKTNVINGSGASAINIQDGGNSITVDGTVTATQGTSPWVISGTVTTGGLTDTQLRASAVPVSLTSTTITGTVLTSLTTNGVTSTANSSTATLGIGAVFTGTSEDVSNYSAIQVSVISDVASATDGLSIQQSSNGTNWDFIDTYTIAAATGKVFSIQPSARFLRVVYTNGGTAQASFRLQTVYHIIAPNPSSQRSADAYTNETDLTQMWAFNGLYNGTTWDRMRGDITNGLDVDVTRLPALVAGAATVGSIASITTSIVPGTAATNLGKAEDAAHTTGDVGVFALAVRNDNAATSVTSANADYSQLSVDTNGSIFNRPAPANTPTTASVAGSVTSVTALAANPARRIAIFYNDSTSDAYVKFGTAASTSSFTLPLVSFGSISFNGEDYAGIISIIWNTATGNLRVTETTV